MELAAERFYSRSGIHPKKFALLLACASMVMMFAGLTSAYLVRQAAGNWLEFQLPVIFAVSTGVILMSSILLHTSYRSFCNGAAGSYRWMLAAATLLGVTFLVLQYQGWLALERIGIALSTNPSGSFVYAISGIHAAHVLGGIAALLVAVLHAFSLPYKVTQQRKLRFELTLIYWHFVDLLWVYLFVFLLMQR
ncbi:MAG: cytochrome c oxidase subunit 3 [Saprospiraceae bacterium]|jgi:cytochrome c oxidase subunit 3